MMCLDSSDPSIGGFAKLFVEYREGGEFYAANFKDGQQVSVARALPHLDHPGDHVEILDCERVERVIDEADYFSLSNCSCRHKKRHAGGQVCKVPLETCTSFGKAADYVVRRGMGRAIAKAEMKDIAQRSCVIAAAAAAGSSRESTSTGTPMRSYPRRSCRTSTWRTATAARSVRGPATLRLLR